MLHVEISQTLLLEPYLLLTWLVTTDISVSFRESWLLEPTGHVVLTWLRKHLCVLWSYLVKGIFIVSCCCCCGKSLQLCPTLCDPIDGSPPGSAVPGILQARTLEWVAISFSSAWKWKVKVKLLSSVWLLATPWTAAHQAPPSMGFSRWEYWSGLLLITKWFCIHST